jgi:hypothetical protein
MHLGVLPRHELAIEPDEALALVKRDDGHELLLTSRRECSEPGTLAPA